MGKAVVSSCASRRCGPLAGTIPRRSKSAAVSEPCESTKGYQIRSVTKALDLLEAISTVGDRDRCDERVRVSHLSKQLGLTKTSVFRLLATFERRGYLVREEPAGEYRIGINAFEVSRNLLLRMPLLREARPVIEELCRRCNEAVYVAVKSDGDFLLIDLAESAQLVKVASLLGRRYPLASGAPGRVMLAYCDTSPEEEGGGGGVVLRDVRQQGYSFDQGSLADLVSCLAAPLFDRDGTIVGAVCLVIPSYRVQEQIIESTFLPGLKEASEAISAKLGYLRAHRSRTPF